MERLYAGTTPLESQDAAAVSAKATVDPPTCVVRAKNDQIVLDALINPVANVKSVELRNFNLDELNTQHLNSLFGGCAEECQSLSLEKCSLSGDRFFAMATERLTRNRVKLVHFRVRSCQQVSMTSLIAMSTLFTSSLVTLELSSCKLPRQAGIILSQSLQAYALKLLHASSGSAVAVVLGQENDMPPSLPLRCLSAAGNAIDSGVGSLLLNNASTLETLCLLGNPLSEDGKLDLNSSQVQFLAAKVEACERALPRLEARLDMLTDRVAAGSAQLSKLQTDVALQLQQVRQEALTQMSNQYSNSGGFHSTQLSPTMSLSSRMQGQVDELVSSRVQASEQRIYAELDRVRADQANATPTDPHAVVNAVSVHLTQFKREFDANQAGVLRQFTESVSSDGHRLEERITQVEVQIGSLESVIQSEQQASLLALEAISDAFNDPAAPISTRKM
ncbi:hypothetical protein KRP22_004649 [Phytophthora ramorum]|nr:hypothetical protein KRP22_10280 [Phytophthora ramorum]